MDVCGNGGTRSDFSHHLLKTFSSASVEVVVARGCIFPLGDAVRFLLKATAASWDVWKVWVFCSTDTTMGRVTILTSLIDCLCSS